MIREHSRGMIKAVRSPDGNGVQVRSPGVDGVRQQERVAQKLRGTEPMVSVRFWGNTDIQTQTTQKPDRGKHNNMKQQSHKHKT